MPARRERAAFPPAGALAACTIIDCTSPPRLHLHAREKRLVVREGSVLLLLRQEPARGEEPNEIKALLDQYVIGQEPAKRILSVAVYNHYKRLKNLASKDEVELAKSNILLIGPTGSGKTLLAQTLARLLNVPFVMADAMASVPPQGGRKHPNQDFLQIDTTNILFICGGAFDGLEKVIQNRTEKSGIGFSATVHSKSEKRVSEMFREVEPEDLIKFGLIPDELTEGALVQILTEPKNALVKQYQKLFSMDGVELEIRSSALAAIARKALARKTGARGLRSIMEHVLIDTMFDLPNLDGVAKVVVDEHNVEEGAKPLLVYREQAKASA